MTAHRRFEAVIPPEGGSLTPRAKKPDYKINHETGCWEWLKHKTALGYGTGSFTTVGIATGHAHRAYYIAAKGDVPSGIKEGVIDHLCRNPSCVNPDHLEYVSPAENVRRGENSKLSLEKAKDIRARAQAGEPLREIAASYDVDENTIGSVVDDWSWREDYSLPRQPVARPVVHCAQCGELITSGKRHKRFCSRPCRYRFNNRKAATHAP